MGSYAAKLRKSCESSMKEDKKSEKFISSKKRIPTDPLPLSPKNTKAATKTNHK